MRDRVEHQTSLDQYNRIGQQAYECGDGKDVEGDAHYSRTRIEEPVGDDGRQSKEQEVIKQVVLVLLDLLLEPGDFVRHACLGHPSTEFLRDEEAHASTYH